MPPSKRILDPKKKRHYLDTKIYFDKSALEKKGYYDSGKSGKKEHSIWQKMVRRITLEFLDSTENKENILDLGCGNGDFSIQLGKRYKTSKVVGVDFSQKALAIGIKESRHMKNISFKRGDLTKRINLRKGAFSMVICINVLHHIHETDIKKAIDEICRLSNDGIIVEIKDKGNLYNRFLRSSKDVPVFSVSYNDMMKSFNRNGYKLVRKKPIFWAKVISPMLVAQFRKTNVKSAK